MRDPLPVPTHLRRESPLAPPQYSLVDRRLVQICGWAIAIGVVAALVAQVLVGLIALVTNLAFFGRLSLEFVAPSTNQLGGWVVVIPVIGAMVIGIMARYGSKAIRGHGIPEAMEQVLVNQSRIPARMTWLKPLSAAISIGTGGPFGAEGPIIATGGAIGSLAGQMLPMTIAERKTLLAAGAAAGMSATFGAPVSAVLLAIELLLFEYRPRSLVPVALASVFAAGIRGMIDGLAPAFAMPDLAPPSGGALVAYVILGGLMGLVAVVVTRLVYAVEDGFERLPIHWMWWPAMGAVAVGTIGYFVPDTLGVGYYNIENILGGKLGVSAVVWLCGMKFLSWVIALGSGTSGGTLAPLFTIGGGCGLAVGALMNAAAPGLGIDLRVAALVGMAALFAGASRALLASAVFAFETTLQPLGLLPLLGGCTASYLVASLLMRNSIMTEKIARRGIRSPAEYLADPLDQFLVRDIASQSVVTLAASQSVGATRLWLESSSDIRHGGFPVVNEAGVLVGVITRREVIDASVSIEKRIGDLVTCLPRFVYQDCSAREAADHMLNHGIGRLPVVDRKQPSRIVGIVTRSDLMSVFRTRADEGQRQPPNVRISLPDSWRKRVA